MSIIRANVIGFLVDIVAKFLTPGRDAGGFFVTALLGYIGAVVGAIVVLFIYNMVRGRRTVV